MCLGRREEGVGVSRMEGGRCGWVCLGRRDEGVSRAEGGMFWWVCVGRREEGVAGCVWDGGR